ncbi:ABC transporter permease [Aquibium oceanicum]|uniref:D-ala-D-ala transporter subunit n=1 Tax=Aquibium oceanicum TaxID=1670800 RepID=A0A1L3SRH1_9HYPH|nr:ABC transporter permease [Aquibium oceanicum]APH71892.1 D-ala-D-ala transporter subunit [Aquibium oceanicum]
MTDTTIASVPASTADTMEEKLDRYREARRAVWLLSRSFSSMLGLAIVVVFMILAVFGPWIAPYPEAALGSVNMEEMLQPPSWQHWFGTDDMGNDVLSRVIIGTRISLQVGLIITLGAALVGVPLGILGGYLGGWVRSIIMALTDLFLSVPSLVLAIAIVAVLGPGIVNTMIALAVVWWPGYVRLIDSKTLAIKEEPYVEAARALGASTPRIIFRYLLPGCASPLIVKASMDMGAAILAAAGLGFIGLGAKAPSPEWGAMLSVARGYLPEWWWFAIFPGMAIYLSVLGFNLLGDGLRDVLDPRTSR